jgi:hypothetical protein
MLAQNVGRAAGLGYAQTHTRHREAGSGAIDFFVDPFFYALANGGFHLIGRSLGFAQVA